MARGRKRAEERLFWLGILKDGGPGKWDWTAPVMESFAMMSIPVPIITPLIVQIGYPVVWWGIVMMCVVETGIPIAVARKSVSDRTLSPTNPTGFSVGLIPLSSPECVPVIAHS